MPADRNANQCQGQHDGYEVFWNSGPELNFDFEVGWYAWACQPGCLPDSEPHGPYDTSMDADFAHNAPDSDMEHAP